MLTSAIAVAALVAVVAYVVVQGRRVRRSALPDQVRAVWDDPESDLDRNILDRLLGKMARPVAAFPALRERITDDQMAALERKLAAAGGLYGGSGHLFVSYQVAAVLLASLTGLAVLALNPPFIILIAGLAFAAAIAGLPWSRVTKAAARREDEIGGQLPEFAELLLMPLQTGISTLPALRFTAERTSGIVSDEIQHMLAQINASVAPSEAFDLAAARLGTQEARAFLGTLEQSYTAGSGVESTLRAQAEALRFKRLMEKKKQIGKLPVKIVAALAVHLLPLLFGVVFIPVVSGLQGGFT